jgi:hypothetical protein
MTDMGGRRSTRHSIYIASLPHDKQRKPEAHQKAQPPPRGARLKTEANRTWVARTRGPRGAGFIQPIYADADIRRHPEMRGCPGWTHATQRPGDTYPCSRSRRRQPPSKGAVKQRLRGKPSVSQCAKPEGRATPSGRETRQTYMHAPFGPVVGRHKVVSRSDATTHQGFKEATRLERHDGARKAAAPAWR